jgi:release factor glutamine methyltransferase
MLLAYVLGVPRSRLGDAHDPGPAETTAFERTVARRAAREPLQHITGVAAFRYRDLEVGPGVFIPRPETEVLAGAAIEELASRVASGERPLAIDLCAGSGAIAAAMASEVPGCRVVAVELSPAAAAYAERNTAGLDVEVRCADMAAGVADLAGQAAVVAANPPYIPLAAYESVAPEAREYDPPLALWSGDDGLTAISMVAEVAADVSRDSGLVLCEHADVQGDLAPVVFARTGWWTSIRDHRDLNGRPRFVSARRVARP